MYLVILQYRDVPANTNFSAVHIPYINPQFYIVNEMLILNIICHTFISVFIACAEF
jgi:hypothetical protein